MKQTTTKTLSVVAIFAAINTGISVRAETVDTRIGKLDLALGMPTRQTVAKLYDELDFQRAWQLYLWAIPIVSSAQQRSWAELTTGTRDGDLLIMEGYRSLSAVLTPNLVTPCIGTAVDLATTGPMVLEVPAGLIAGAADDYWQRLLTDFDVTGPDQGKGATYLLVGPGQEVPETKDAVVLPEQGADRRPQLTPVRPREERRWLGRPLLRSGRATRLREELDPHHAGQSVVRLVPALGAAGTVPRQDLEAAGHREGQVNGERQP
jgi:hypothetical protein